MDDLAGERIGRALDPPDQAEDEQHHRADRQHDERAFEQHPPQRGERPTAVEPCRDVVLPHRDAPRSGWGAGGRAWSCARRLCTRRGGGCGG